MAEHSEEVPSALCRHCWRRMPRECFPVKSDGKKISRFCNDCINRALKKLNRKKNP